LAGVMLSMWMPSTPLTVPRVPLTTYVPVSPLENLASSSATEASALSEALSSYRLPSTSNCGRLYVPDAAAVPVKVSLSAAHPQTPEPTSAGSRQREGNERQPLHAAIRSFLFVHGLLTRVMPAGTPRQRADNCLLALDHGGIPPL